ncbi:MAG: tripartite tricarboxylate transporter substrate binding protein [Betaproteobacteria bacterium]|nr:tripartite tricarboxylate transporter substrate binding protein [Betaproteobacteria bacterium]
MYLLFQRLVVMALGGLFSGLLMAQSWPHKPIKMVAPYPPGGPSDIVMRMVADKLQLSLKQPIFLENQSGAGGNIGASYVSRSAPDGYTFLVATDTIMTVNPHVYKNMSFKMDDFRVVSMLSSFSQTLVCNPSVGVKSVADLIAKAKTGSMSYASGGAGVPGHLSMELFLALIGVQMVHVPYKGPAPAAQDVLAGQVPCGFLAGPTVLPHIKAGKLVALAVSGVSRSPSLPDIPTMVEAGVKGYEADFSLVVFAPKQVSEEIIQKLRQALVDALRTPDASEKLKLTDQVVIASTSEEATAKLNKDSAKWGSVVKRIGLGMD